jgi:hypothetical protein
VSLFFAHFYKTNLHYMSPQMSNVYVFNIASAFSGFKVRFLISSYCAGNVTLCREQHVARELRVERACSSTRAWSSDIANLKTFTCHIHKSPSPARPYNLFFFCNQSQWRLSICQMTTFEPLPPSRIPHDFLVSLSSWRVPPRCIIWQWLGYL